MSDVKNVPGPRVLSKTQRCFKIQMHVWAKRNRTQVLPPKRVLLRDIHMCGYKIYIVAAGNSPNHWLTLWPLVTILVAIVAKMQPLRWINVNQNQDRTGRRYNAEASFELLPHCDWSSPANGVFLQKGSMMPSFHVLFVLAWATLWRAVELPTI